MLKKLIVDLLNKKKQLLVKSDLMLSPEEIAVRLNTAVRLHQNKQYEKAIEIYENIIKCDESNVDALHLLGLVKHAQNKNEEAISLLEKSIKINPSFVGAQVNLAVILRAVLRYDESLIYINKVLTVAPNNLEALLCRGSLFLEMSAPTEAIKDFDNYLNLDKENPTIFQLKGAALLLLGRFSDALTYYDKAIELDKNSAKYYIGKANVLLKLQNYSEAIKNYQQAQILQPDNAYARYNEGLTRLLIGDYAEGWPLYESRYEADPRLNLNLEIARWDGKKELDNKILLIYAEQGFGDTFQFSRYISFFSEINCVVYFCVPKELLSFFNKIPVNINLFIGGDVIPQPSYQCSLMSLPFIFDTQLDSIPPISSQHVINSDKVDFFNEKFKYIKNTKIGVFWSSNTSSKFQSKNKITDNDLSLRNIHLLDFSAIFGADGFFVSVAKEISTADKIKLGEYENVCDASEFINDFSDTAAIIDQMDLVITIDTAVAHLAGSMGKSVWILLPFDSDWRWLVNRDDSPWYPTARLFRQHTRGDWSSVLAAVSKALEEQFSR